MSLDIPAPVRFPALLVLRICALECEVLTSPLFPLSYRVHHRHAHARYPFDPRPAPHLRADGSVDRRLSLGRFCHVATSLDHDYWRASAAVVAAQTLTSTRRSAVLQRLDDHEFDFFGTTASLFHAGPELAFALHVPKLLELLPTVRLSRCWRATAKHLRTDHMAFREVGVPYEVGAHCPLEPQCAIWMPLPSAALGGGKARPLPPHHTGLPAALPQGQHQAVCIVVNNCAETDAELIDVAASVAQTGPGSEAAVAGVVQRIMDWLDVAFYDRSTYTPDRYAREERALANQVARGFPAVEFTNRKGHNQFTAHAEKTHFLEQHGSQNHDPRPAPPPRKGRPRLPDEVRQAREQAAQDKREARAAAQAAAKAAGATGALALARAQLAAERAAHAELRARIERTACSFDVMPSDALAEPADIADGLRSLLD